MHRTLDPSALAQTRSTSGSQSAVPREANERRSIRNMAHARPVQGNSCLAGGIQQHQGSLRLCLDHRAKQQRQTCSPEYGPNLLVSSSTLLVSTIFLGTELYSLIRHLRGKQTQTTSAANYLPGRSSFHHC